MYCIEGGLKIEGEDDAYDFGSGAGFYVDATKAPYNAGYNMYSYITEELPQTVFAAFPQLDSSNVSITGHSMGGHGALTLVSTFIPPSLLVSNCPSHSYPSELHLTNYNSTSETRASTSQSLLLRLFPTPSTAPGARRPSRATLERTSSRSGRNMMRQSFSRITPATRANLKFLSMWYVLYFLSFSSTPDWFGLAKNHSHNNFIGYGRQLLQAGPAATRKPREGCQRRRPYKGELRDSLPRRLRPLVLLHVILCGQPR